MLLSLPIIKNGLNEERDVAAVFARVGKAIDINRPPVARVETRRKFLLVMLEERGIVERYGDILHCVVNGLLI